MYEGFIKESWFFHVYFIVWHFFCSVYDVFVNQSFFSFLFVDINYLLNVVHPTHTEIEHPSGTLFLYAMIYKYIYPITKTFIFNCFI